MQLLSSNDSDGSDVVGFWAEEKHREPTEMNINPETLKDLGPSGVRSVDKWRGRMWRMYCRCTSK